ncbi:MAG: hypothetical protein U5J64_00440 [Halobacteriales archaeon]|nr:hypothetical protein [Halobacteriales archaeon]
MDTVSRRDFLSTSMFIFLTGVTGCLSDGNDTDRIDVTASMNDVEIPRAEFEVTATNRGDETFVTTPESLSVAKLSDGEPKHIRRAHLLLQDGPALELEPGDSETWEINVDNEDESFLGDTGGMEMNLTGLGPGTYLFGFPSDTETYGVDEGRATSVEFVGEQPEVTPVDGAEAVERDGRLYVVPRSEDNDTGVVAVVSKVDVGEAEDVPEGTPELITEQVLQFGVTRNSVHFFDATEGTDELHVKGDRTAAEMDVFGQIARLTADGVSSFFAHSGNSYYFKYEGNVYEIRIE